MRASREFRDRSTTEVAVLDALVGHHDDGMTVFDIRAHVDEDIDAIEVALAALKEDGLIRTEDRDGRLLIFPAERVMPDPGAAEEPDESFLQWLRRKLPF